MRKLFIALFAANVVLAFVSLPLLPETVAIHFGTGGLANGWASREANLITALCLDVFMFAMMYYTPALAFKFPRKYLSLPNKDYWLSDENRPRAVAMLTSMMCDLGTAMFGLMLVAGLLTIEANLSDPVRLNEPLFLTAFGVFMAYSVWWTVMIFVRFRIPK